MRIAPRRLWGWEPSRRIIPDGDEWVVETEPEFDQEQYEMFAALAEHEASLGAHGHPLDETMSPLADPDNPNGTHFYRVEPVRDWLEQAQYDAESDPKWQGENATPARKWRAVKIER